MPPAEAAIAGARRMFWPVVASALTTVAAFLPLMLVQGIMGKVLGDIPFVAITVLMASLFEVFLIMPSHLRGAFGHQVQREPARWRRRVDAGFDHFRDRIYRPLVTAAIRWRGLTVSAVAVMMLLAVGLMAGGRIAFVFFPTPESQIVFANATFVAGTPREKTAAFLAELERGLAAAERELGGGLVDAAVARLGSTVAVEAGAGAQGDQLASVLVQLVPSEQRRVRNEQFLAAWRRHLKPPAGIESLAISARRAGPPGRDLNVRLTADDALTLKDAALDLAQGLEGIAGVSDMTDDMPYGREQLFYRVSPAGQALGVTTELLGRQLRAAFDGHLAQLVQVGQDELEVRVLLPRAERTRLDALERLSIRVPGGRFVHLDTVADWETRRGFEALRHADGRLAVEVTADIDRAQNTTGAVQQTLVRDLLPDIVKRYGVAYSFEGRAADQRDTRGDMRLGLILGLALIFLILAAVFASWTWPLVVMTSIPLGLVGAIVGHWVVGIDHPVALRSLRSLRALGDRGQQRHHPGQHVPRVAPVRPRGGRGPGGCGLLTPVRHVPHLRHDGGGAGAPDLRDQPPGPVPHPHGSVPGLRNRVRHRARAGLHPGAALCPRILPRPSEPLARPGDFGSELKMWCGRATALEPAGRRASTAGWRNGCAGPIRHARQTRAGTGTFSGLYWFAPKVSQSFRSPFLTPLANHSARCLDVPCVKVCGMAKPRDCFCSRSSPMEAAATSASSRSPSSRISNCRCAWFAQMPA